MTKRGQEHTFVRFTMTEGDVTDMHYRQKSIVYAAKGPITNDWGGDTYPQRHLQHQALILHTTTQIRLDTAFKGLS